MDPFGDLCLVFSDMAEVVLAGCLPVRVAKRDLHKLPWLGVVERRGVSIQLLAKAHIVADRKGVPGTPPANWPTEPTSRRARLICSG